MKVKIPASNIQKILSALPTMEGSEASLLYSAPDGLRRLRFVRCGSPFNGLDEWVLEVDIVKFPRK